MSGQSSIEIVQSRTQIEAENDQACNLDYAISICKLNAK